MAGRSILIMLILAVCGALVSCATANVPMTASEARGLCMSYKDDDQDHCLDSNSVCDRYQQIMTAKYANAAECRKACNDLSIQLTSGMPGIGCGYISRKGLGTCVTYCDSNY